MGLLSLIKAIRDDEVKVARRPAQVYTTAIGAYTLFNITGAVELLTFGGLVTAAAVGGETIVTTVNGVAADAGATAINGAVGTIVYLPLNVAGTLLNAAAAPKTVATLTTMIAGQQPAGVGLIVATFATGTSWTGEIFLSYRKLSTNGRIVVA